MKSSPKGRIGTKNTPEIPRVSEPGKSNQEEITSPPACSACINLDSYGIVLKVSSNTRKEESCVESKKQNWFDDFDWAILPLLVILLT